VRVQDLGLRGATDEAVLVRAASGGRVVLTTGPKHCGHGAIVSSHAIAFARDWLQLQSAAQAASSVE
jgi:hypothetical protein